MDVEGPLRERLIDAGVELVLSEGTASVGLREIARRAGVSHGAPRRYFPTHRALLSAIARRGFEELVARSAVATAGTAVPRDELAALARVYVTYALERRGMFELMFRHDLLDSGKQSGTPDGPRLREATLPMFQRVTELVTRCRARALEPSAAVTAAALWANLHGIAQLSSWGSLQLALGGEGCDSHDRLIEAALDAHLGSMAS
ncbi:TetR family transcriptional regulator [Streptomyces phaeoluteigriseus]|jgi:AcrR family transcriptional regulator|uniref:TetR family transcriptional regulator n=1 Tax=Streptomyces phaeoluteigriseus TaxID=114686 RepID=A0A1V6MYK2_9ACTN|nr:TetR/AcrR family transcriptional regulator [Streptomyces phaeoluteigriseus]OQD57383.1 TetR family transcriptional regulator [Streptomyces phaeoluteigriseus]